MSLCKCCRKRPSDQKHHLFSNTKWARKLYGALIDDPRNLMDCCGACNASHANPDLIHWSELDFCNALGIEPRSKIMKGRQMKALILIFLLVSETAFAFEPDGGSYSRQEMEDRRQLHPVGWQYGVVAEPITLVDRSVLISNTPNTDETVLIAKANMPEPVLRTEDPENEEMRRKLEQVMQRLEQLMAPQPRVTVTMEESE